MSFFLIFSDTDLLPAADVATEKMVYSPHSRGFLFFFFLNRPLCFYPIFLQRYHTVVIATISCVPQSAARLSTGQTQPPRIAAPPRHLQSGIMCYLCVSVFFTIRRAVSSPEEGYKSGEIPGESQKISSLILVPHLILPGGVFF